MLWSATSDARSQGDVGHSYLEAPQQQGEALAASSGNMEQCWAISESGEGMDRIVPLFYYEEKLRELGLFSLENVLRI